MKQVEIRRYCYKTLMAPTCVDMARFDETVVAENENEKPSGR